MVDLDALRAELEAAGVSCAIERRGPEWDDIAEVGLYIGGESVVTLNGEFSLDSDYMDVSALAIIARHLGHGPAPLTAELRGQIINVMAWAVHHSYCDEIPDTNADAMREIVSRTRAWLDKQAVTS